MQIVKQSTACDLPCIIVASADGYTPDTTVTDADVTISFRKEGETAWSSKTASGNWTNVGKGVYLISWSATDLDTVGRFDFVVEHAGAINYYGSVVVSANLIDDVESAVDGLNDVSANDVRDAILDDATRFSGAHIDATVSSRSAHSAADVVALMNDPTVAAIVAGVWSELQAGYTEAGTFGRYLDAAISSVGGGSAPTAAEIAAAVHNIKVSFNKTTGALEIRMADDTLLTSVTITDTATEVTRE
ncbi:MAG: hypothetical protein OCU12_07030 [Methanophagales archaeon]|nr:hypothetical protein [Methanophagales archaeon]